MRMCECVCVCVNERVGEREKECVCVCVRACVCVGGFVLMPTLLAFFISGHRSTVDRREIMTYLWRTTLQG